MSRRELRVAAVGLLRAHHTARRRVMVFAPLPPELPAPPQPWAQRVWAAVRAYWRYVCDLVSLR